MIISGSTLGTTGIPYPLNLFSGSTLTIEVDKGPGYLTVEANKPNSGGAPKTSRSAKQAEYISDGYFLEQNNTGTTSEVTSPYIASCVIPSTSTGATINIPLYNPIAYNELNIKYVTTDTSSVVQVTSTGSDPANLILEFTKTSTSFTGSSDTASLVPQPGETFNYTIDWGDGSPTTSSTTDTPLFHIYPSDGVYTASISGIFPGFYYQNNFSSSLSNIIQWGTGSYTNLLRAFSSQFFQYSSESFQNFLNTPDWPKSDTTFDATRMFANMNISGSFPSNALNRWDFSKISNAEFPNGMSLAFSYVRQSGSKQERTWDVSNWDISNQTDITALFYGGDSSGNRSGNAQDDSYQYPDAIVGLENWDVSNIGKSSTNVFGEFYYLFYAQPNLQGVDLRNWDVSNVKIFTGMFSGAGTRSTSSWWDVDIRGWDFSSAVSMSTMFYEFGGNNQHIYNSGLPPIRVDKLDFPNWNTSNVKNMRFMFARFGGWGFTTRNGVPTGIDPDPPVRIDLSNWDVSNVEDMENMFDGVNCTHLGDLSNWNVSNVQNFADWIQECGVIKEIQCAGWDLSSCTRIDDMFYSCSQLSEIPISWTNTGNITNMNRAFGSLNYSSSVGIDATCSLDFSTWDFDKVNNMTNFLQNTHIGTSSYDTLLNRIAATHLSSSIVFGGGPNYYTSAGSASRAALVADGWTITDLGEI